MISRRPHPLAARGFTLVEMAVVLVVVALVLGSLLVPLASQVEQRRIDNTAQTLEQARDALLAFAAARGRLPCPAGTANGQEVLTTNAAAGDCANFWGYLPAATLGLSPLDADGYARDGWGLDQNRIRYAVRNATVGGQTFVFTKTGGIKAAGMPAFNSWQFLYVCNSGSGVTAGSDCGSAFTLTSEAVAVIWAVGPNAALPMGGASTDEAENPNPNGGSADRIFVSRPRATGTAAEYDDQMVWVTPPILFQRMIAAGQLP
ncbi:MAG: prepilin-type N-terminal cleavage/methylation domain-containing protein [Burkholderiales bacterium]|jgi:prepilin-type N-terminal cleavage/methylation domain-containing protein